MTDKPRWTRERKPKRRIVRVEPGKRQLQEQLRTALETIAHLQEQLAEQDARGLRLEAENERLRKENQELRDWSEGDWWDEVERLRAHQERTKALKKKAEAEVERLRNNNDLVGQALLDENERLRADNRSLRDEIPYESRQELEAVLARLRAENEGLRTDNEGWATYAERKTAEVERLREERDHFVEVAHDANVRLREVMSKQTGT
jgi:chromosome segregation ATPase